MKDEMKEAMQLILGGAWKDHPFGRLQMKTTRDIVEKINERLEETPYFYMICGDALAVFNRESAIGFAKATFDSKYPMAAYYEEDKMKTKEVKEGIKKKRQRESGAKIHELKSDYQKFVDVIRDEKLVEIREDDRGFEVGDYILLRQTAHTGYQMEHDGYPLVYTGRVSFLKITHIEDSIGLWEDHVALSIKRLD